jgi:hypothetical protein
MKMKLIDDRAISPNSKTGNNTPTFAYAVTTRIDEKAIFCMCRKGQTKHSYDGILVGQLSGDGGENWGDPAVVCDLRRRIPPESIISGQILTAPDGSLCATFSTIVVTAPDSYIFSSKGFKQKRRHYKSLSYDRGRTWSVPVPIGLFKKKNPCILGQSFVLPGGELFITAGYFNRYNTRVITAFFSGDNGKSFSPLADLITDRKNELNYDDPFFTVFPDKTILGLFWTYRKETEETIEVHRSVSCNDGRSWSDPEPVGKLGQISVPLALDKQTIIVASNYRRQTGGIRLWISYDRGLTFDKEDPFHMWDPRQEKITGKQVAGKTGVCQSQGVWEALEGFTFGTPGLLDLGEGAILLTYYATISGITHIRACRFLLY